MKRVQRNISPPISTFPSSDRGLRLGLKALSAHCQRSSQKAIFRATAQPLIFAILVAGLLVELRARLAPPPPPPPPPSISTTVTIHGNTIAQCVLIWAEAHWPGMWALPVMCVCALAVLRVAVCAGAAVVDGFEEGAANGVKVGRWEDGRSVSGSDLLAGVFT